MEPNIKTTALAKLLQENAEREIQLRESIKKDPDLKNAICCNQIGSAMINADKYPNARKAFEQAIDYFNKFASKSSEFSKTPYTNAYFNLGKALSALKLYQDAAKCYRQCIESSPFKIIEKASLEEYSEACKYTKQTHFNNFECLVESYSELAVMQYKLDDSQSAYETCMIALNLQPNKSEVIKTLGNVLRQLNKRDEAIELVWRYVEYAFQHDPANKSKAFLMPKRIECKKAERSQQPENNKLHVICVKYGTLYGPEYANKLYHGVETFLTIPHDFICFTDNPAGLEPNIIVVPIDGKYKGWWSKANIFNISSKFI